MKKIISIFLLFLLIGSISVYAADEYSFGLEYQGEIITNEEKDAAVTLTGVNATPYTNVLIKVDIEGPAKPKLLAYDSAGIEYDIAELGSWGPPAGFAVGGDFTNRTPIRATFTEAGDYQITLSLIDVANNNQVITSKVFGFVVANASGEGPATQENTTENTTVENTITEIPKTGLSYEEIIITCSVIIAIICCGIYFSKRKYEV